MQRIQSLDLARGFTVLFIPAIHTGMLYSNVSVHKSLLGYFLIAIAEGPGGQLLMVLMGISFTFKKRHNTRIVLLRCILLLLAGYLLNILKFLLPYSLDGLPEGVSKDLQLTGHDNDVWLLIGLGDILHFSAIATALLLVVYRLPSYQRVALYAAMTVAVTAPFLWDIHFSNPLLNYISSLVGGQPPRVFFPLFPWLVYPFFGLYAGYYYQRNPNRAATRLGLLGIMLLVTGLLLEYFFLADNPFGFYRTAIPATIWHLGSVLLALYLWHMISLVLNGNPIVKLFIHSSKHITIIYIIQWVMICWSLPVFGYQQLDVISSTIVMIAMTINTYVLTYFIQLIKSYYGIRKTI